ncbi:MAG: LamG domain-containing protein [Colwellia sp.]|nr:LamG domain-containing protein [Colwellia sp.]
MYVYKKILNPTEKPSYGSIVDPTHPLSQELKACYLFNECAGDTVFDIAKGNNGLFNLVDWGNNKVSFDKTNNQKITIPYSDDMIFGQEFTLNFILAGRDLTGWSTIFAQFNDSSRNIYLHHYDGFVSFHFKPNYPQNVSSVTLTNNKVTHLTVTFSSDGLKGYKNGKLEYSQSYNGAMVFDDRPCLIGCNESWSDESWGGDFIYTSLYPRRCLSESEVYHLNAEPYANILTPQYLYVCDFGGISSNDSFLACESVNYNLTLSNISLLKQIVITCESINYGLSFNDVDLLKDSSLLCDSINYNLTFSDAALLKNSLISCEQLSYGIAINDATLTKTVNGSLFCESVNYTLTLNDVALQKSSLINCESVNYGITLNDVVLLKDSLVGCEAVSHALTIVDIDLLKQSLINCESVNYNLTLSDVDLVKTAVGSLSCESVSYGLTLSAVDLLKDSLLGCETNNYNLAINDVSLFRLTSLACESVNYGLTLSDADLLKNSLVDCEQLNYNLTITDITLTKTAFSSCVWTQEEKDLLINMVTDLYKLQGLDAATPLTVTPTSRVAGTVTQAISGDGVSSSTVQRT